MTLAFRPPPDYGSGGWGFESLAARHLCSSPTYQLAWSPWRTVAGAAAASSRFDRHPAVAFVVGAVVGRVRVPAAADVEAVAILPLCWTPGRRQVVAECVTALGRDAAALGDLLGDPAPGVALCFAQLRPVDGRAGQVGLEPGVIGDPAKKLRARDRDWGPVGRRWWPVIAHGSPWRRHRG